MTFRDIRFPSKDAFKIMQLRHIPKKCVTMNQNFAEMRNISYLFARKLLGYTYIEVNVNGEWIPVNNKDEVLKELFSERHKVEEAVVLPKEEPVKVEEVAVEQQIPEEVSTTEEPVESKEVASEIKNKKGNTSSFLKNKKR